MTSLWDHYVAWLREKMRPKGVGHCLAGQQHQWLVSLDAPDIAVCQTCGTKIAANQLKRV